MQIAIIEFARDVLGWADANSTEFDPNTEHPVIDLMPEQKSITDLGGTMRLGAYPCVLSDGSKAHWIFKSVIATVMRSIMTSAQSSRKPVCSSSASRRTATSWR